MRHIRIGLDSSIRQCGFTLIELVTVIILVGILAVYVAPRFADKTFDERGFHDAVLAAIQHARRSAVASRRYECVSIDAAAGTVTVTRDTSVPESIGAAAAINCDTAIPLPSLGRGCANPNQVCAPTGTTIEAGSTASLIFDPLGRLVTKAPNADASANLAADATITITGASAITVLAETGYTR